MFAQKSWATAAQQNYLIINILFLSTVNCLLIKDFCMLHKYKYYTLVGLSIVKQLPICYLIVTRGNYLTAQIYSTCNDRITGHIAMRE